MFNLPMNYQEKNKKGNKCLISKKNNILKRKETKKKILLKIPEERKR